MHTITKGEFDLLLAEDTPLRAIDSPHTTQIAHAVSRGRTVVMTDGARVGVLIDTCDAQAWDNWHGYYPSKGYRLVLM